MLKPFLANLGWRRLALLFALPLLVYALFSWERLSKPSPQFHFVDLAQSFLDGRLDTDTPTQRASAKKPDDPPGYRAAIKRAVDGGGWNDWASYHIVTLKGGEVVEGVWPHGDQSGGQEKYFHTLDGRVMVVDKALDIAKGCESRADARERAMAEAEGEATAPGKAAPKKARKSWKACDEKVHFVSFPPFPAVLMMPLVAIFGYHVNDVLFTIFFSALNVLLMFLMLDLFSKRGISTRSTRENLILALFFAFGTSHFFSSVRGEVWFTALILGVTLHLLFILAVTGLRHPILAGFLLAFGFLTRTPILFGGGVYAGLQLLWPEGRWLGFGLKGTIKRALGFGLPLLAIFALALLYNQARWGNPLEFGHTYLQDGMRPAVRDHGLMSFHFLNRNLSAAFLNFPRLQAEVPFLRITRHGMGLLWSTPVFFLLFRLRRFDAWTRTLMAAIAFAMIPALLYQNTGWAQFTFRFSLDVTPYLILLLALDDRPIDKRYMALIVLAIVIQTFGAATFGRVGMFYYD